MRWQTFLVGAIGLAFLELVISSRQASSNVGGFLSGLGGFVEKFVSPAYPGLSAPAKTTSGTSSIAYGTPSLYATAAPAPPALSPTGTGGITTLV